MCCYILLYMKNHQKLCLSNETFVCFVLILRARQQKVHCSSHQRKLNRKHYWCHLIYFEVSMVAGLSWYIQTTLVHSKQIPSDHANLEALMPFVQNESIRLFNIYYRTDESSKFQVADLVGETKLNGLAGKIHSYNHQTQLYNVLIFKLG